LLQPFVSVTAIPPSAVDDGRANDVKPASADVDVSGAAHTSQDVTAAAAERTPQTLQLRVRAEFLDRITTSGAELLVGSSRMASDLQLQRQSVTDLSDNLLRLRAQLRELEIHAESRIASGFTPSNAAEFDPLEFDRYTRLHELTRMMSESIADISSLQRTLSRQLDSAVITVTTQGRHARVLQSDLRRVRTIPFASLSGRLQHLLRQAAREKDCDVIMEIDGGNLEVDRGVLDRITGPLEHLVRNAVAHGIETAAERLSLGKPATGRVRMDLSQQGNTLQLQISDDGRGLDYARIRERAIAAGLLTSDAQADEAALAELIFEPGFSTASQVTELSGRGIGMDAVRTAVIALGGQMNVLSERGAGTRFIFSLPLTLVTMHVVLVTASSREVALPATLVQQMLQLSSAELAQVRGAGEMEWQGRHVSLHRLSTLLGEPVSGQEIATRTPVAVLRQLDQYLAIELDAVIGHREVVVKNLGPQVAKVPGIAGATVLGDGSITLIINPMPLPDFVAAHCGNSANMNSAEVSENQAPKVLVVDDSLTVRRASQRLLERHGYAVVLARDGLDALEQLRLNTPAAVLLDIEMPRMDGFELLTALRDDARWRALPVAMITSRTAERHREHAMKLGATAYLGKPFVEEELLGLLTQWLAKMPADFRRENRIPADVSG
jgi:chemosensory pili system protein ChpA (sensor histidine kinase/response regulator)